jgi:pimeloyl-ACP methyl ester carboxylesterase
MLVGHSFGGLYDLTFAAQYPDQVAGMVLLDSTAPVVGPAPATNGSYDFVGRISMLVAATANLGAAHLLGDSYDSLPPRSRDEARASVSTARSVHSYINEFREGATVVCPAFSGRLNLCYFMLLADDSGTRCRPLVGSYSRVPSGVVEYCSGIRCTWSHPFVRVPVSDRRCG